MEANGTSLNRELIEQGQLEQLQNLCEGHEEVKVAAGQVQEGEQGGYQACVDKLSQQRTKAEEKLSEMQQGNLDGFHELSLASQIALDEMKEALCVASEQYLGKKFGAHGQATELPSASAKSGQ